MCLQKLIDYIRLASHSTCYATSMPAPVAQQVIAATRQISGHDGTTKGTWWIVKVLCFLCEIYIEGPLYIKKKTTTVFY